MKVLFINNGLTHYYNLVLNRLAREPDIDLVVLVPSEISRSVGGGVHLSREGIDFRVVEREEIHHLFMYHSFRGLYSLLLEERPDVIIFNDYYLYAFIFNLPLLFLTRLRGIKLVMKSIPFRVPRYSDARGRAFSEPLMIEGTSPLLKLCRTFPRLLGAFRLAELAVRKFAYCTPDAHVNYVDEAIEVYGSYGVPGNRIFVTRNSPDTDHLFAIRERAGLLPQILPQCRHRIIHVGRLVDWKRVDLLLKAFARIGEQYRDAELLIIGSGPEEENLKALAGVLNITSAVRFAGGIYDPLLLGRYFMASSLYVLAGMGGLSINEAMCFGLPVICSECDGTEKVLVRDGFNGLMFQAGDEDDLVRVIGDMFEQSERSLLMGERSTGIIRHEVNIHTVIAGYMQAIRFVTGKTLLPGAGGGST